MSIADKLINLLFVIIMVGCLFLVAGAILVNILPIAVVVLTIMILLWLRDLLKELAGGTNERATKRK